MSNFHEFGAGKVAMRAGFDADGGLIFAFTDIEEAMPMDVPYPVEQGIPMQSTVMKFPTREAFNRYISFLQESAERWS